MYPADFKIEWCGNNLVSVMGLGMTVLLHQFWAVLGMTVLCYQLWAVLGSVASSVMGSSRNDSVASSAMGLEMTVLPHHSPL